MARAEAGQHGIEQFTIFPIPPDQRQGRARDLFTLWFGINMHVLSVVTGAITTVLLKLPLGWAAAALILGNLLGGVFMALHSAQGPRLGVPQMVQSRGQFGSIGALFTLFAMMIVYIGFVASNFVVGSQSLHGAMPGLSQAAGIAVIAMLSAVGAGLGHDMLHKCGRWMTVVSGLALIACFVWIFSGQLPANLWSRGTLSLAGVLGTLSLCAIWQIAYAPYVSDYSRYLPADSGARPAFWASYSGCVLGSILPMVLGALLGTIIGTQNIVDGLTRSIGPLAWYVVVALALGMASASAMNIYSGVLTAITIGQTFAASWRPRAGARAIAAIVLNLIAATLALRASENFLSNFESFLSLLLCMMSPWTAINLVDYYLVRRGAYDVASFFAVDGGIYGRYNKPALTCLAVAILVQIPFVKTGIYSGPLVAALGGLDISWMIGLIVAGGLYYGCQRYYGVNRQHRRN